MFLKNKKFLTRGAVLFALVAAAFSFVGCDFSSRELPTGVKVPPSDGVIVEFRPNGGNLRGRSTPLKIDVLSGDDLDLHDYTPSRSGYTFIGWEDEAGKFFAAGEQTIKVNSGMILTAMWEVRVGN